MNSARILSIITMICFSAFAHALDKNDLEKAIRSLDIESVRLIVATEKFTQREYGRYLDLVSQMINDRKFSVRGALLKRDAITSCDRSTADRSGLEQLSGAGLMAIGSKMLVDTTHPDSGTAVVAIAFIFAGITLFVKSYYTFNAYLNKELRPKHDDAITIKQIIYSAHIEGL